MSRAPHILLLLGLLVSCSSPREAPALPYGDMREGDLAFRCGEGLFSRAVTSVENEGVYSHVGILVRDGETWKVVHAVPGEKEGPDDFDRVKAEVPEFFFAPDRACAGALVHTGLTDAESLERIRNTALSWARDSIRFDGKYDLADSLQLYCSELVWRLYRQEGIDLSEGRRKQLNIIVLQGDCLLPEHLFHYTENHVYFKFHTL